MNSLWFLCVILAQLLPKEITSQDTSQEDEDNDCNLKVMVFAGYLRTMCAPLQAVWTLNHGFCRKGYTCTKGYTEEECIKNCLKKPKPKSLPTAATEMSEEQSSGRTRRGQRRRTTPIPEKGVGRRERQKKKKCN